MIRNVQDVSYPSGAVAPGLGTAFQTAPNLEPIDAQVLDARAAASPPLGIGKLFVELFTAANSQDGSYTSSAIVNQPLPMFSFGVVVGVPAPSAPASGNAGAGNANGLSVGGGSQIRLRQKGTCLASCTTGATLAIAPGTPLAADGAGNLTAAAAGAANGAVLAIAKGTLAISSAGLVLVNVGGY
jgi:hypothetical protein